MHPSTSGSWNFYRKDQKFGAILWRWNELRMVKVEFKTFLEGRFPSLDALIDKWVLQPLVWWQYHGFAFPTLQTLVLKIFGQPCSSSCVKRNWSTYKFIHSLKGNKIALARAEDLVYVHSNLRLSSRCHKEHINATTKTWDIVGDSWNESDIHGGAGILENTALTLDEPELEAMVIWNASTSVITSESEVKSEAIDLDNEDDGCIWLSWTLIFYFVLVSNSWVV